MIERVSKIFTVTNQALTSSGQSAVVDTSFGQLCRADVYINVTAISGTPNLAIKLQMSNDSGTTWFDHPTVTFTAMTAVSKQVKLDSWVGGATHVRLDYVVTGGTPSLTTNITMQLRAAA